MNKERKCLVGHDGLDTFFAIVAIIIYIAFLALGIYGWLLIGGFFAIKNYIIAIKDNIID